jgi:hypothetical protein
MTRAGKFFSAFARSTPLVSSTAAIGTAFADEMSGMNVSAGAMSHGRWFSHVVRTRQIHTESNNRSTIRHYPSSSPRISPALIEKCATGIQGGFRNIDAHGRASTCAPRSRSRV